jgi:hypothetical protein
MAITTRVASFYAGQKLFAALLCVVFGLWGAYDYWVKIPNQEEAYAKYQALLDRAVKIEEHVAKQGGVATPEQHAEHEQIKVDLLGISPDGSVPTQPSKFNRMTQWIYIACIPVAPVFFVLFFNAKRQRYTLDDDGTMHFTGDKELKSGTWTRDEIVDIDMSRWMAKSIAYAVHADGRRLKLDAYLHKDLHLIVGALASRFYPDQWDDQAKVVKSPAADELDESGDNSPGSEPVSETAAT